jgi:hypothetical protein
MGLSDSRTGFHWHSLENNQRVKWRRPIITISLVRPRRATAREKLERQTDTQKDLPMSMDIYAAKFTETSNGKMVSPVIDFKHWNKEILADNAEERDDIGETPFIPNPDYIENGGINLSNGNACRVFTQIGLSMDEDDALFEIDDVYRAVMRGLNGAAADHTEEDVVSTGAQGATMVSCGVQEGYMRDRLGQILAIIVKGRTLGATHIAVV